MDIGSAARGGNYGRFAMSEYEWVRFIMSTTALTIVLIIIGHWLKYRHGD
jgi:hypothetical protein